jgi:hypothetical protein
LASARLDWTVASKAAARLSLDKASAAAVRARAPLRFIGVCSFEIPMQKNAEPMGSGVEERLALS